MKIAVLGSAHLSLVSRVEGSTHGAERSGELSITFGGTGFNLATILARLGSEVTFGTIMADTAISRLIVADLQRAGVDVLPEFRKGLPEAGYSAHLGLSGSILSAVSSTPVSQASFRRSYLEAICAGADVLVLECNLSNDTLVQVTKIANVAAIPVWVAGVSELKALKVLDLIKAECKISGLFLNELELENLLRAAGAGEQRSSTVQRFGHRSSSQTTAYFEQPQDLARQLDGFIFETRGPAGLVVWHGERFDPIAQYRCSIVSAGNLPVNAWRNAGDHLMARTIHAIEEEGLEAALAGCQVSQVLSENPQLLAHQVGAANPLEEGMSSLHDSAIYDHLTTLLNRSGLEESLAVLGADDPISVLMLDIDHFKLINDTVGHAGGDEVLRTIGSLIKGALRTSDLGCRWGGEEMMAILPAASVETALDVAERLRLAIEAQSFSHGKVTCSIGVGTGTVGTFEQIAQAADAALYQAKRTGRNRVIVAEAISDQQAVV